VRSASSASAHSKVATLAYGCECDDIQSPGKRNCSAIIRIPAREKVIDAEHKDLFLTGISKSEIARRLDIGRTSVRRILAGEIS